MSNLGIIIPVFNEEKKIESVIKKLKKFEVYIVNDGSTDRTLNILKKYRKYINIINLKKNVGYENAIIHGFKKINKKFKHILTLDGDGQHSPDYINKVYNFYLNENLDLLVGNRSKLNRRVEYLLSFLFSLKFNIKDPLSGFKIYNVKKLKLILKKRKNDKTFLVSILNEFLKKKYKVKNYKIKTKTRYGSRVGDNIYINLKILSLLKFCF